MADETEVERLRRDCAEAYQAVGCLAHAVGYCSADAPDALTGPITKLLDNLSAAENGDPRPHEDLLPFSLPEIEHG